MDTEPRKKPAGTEIGPFGATFYIQERVEKNHFPADTLVLSGDYSLHAAISDSHVAGSAFGSGTQHAIISAC